LVEFAQRGDTHAIEVLYDRYATAILRYCRSLLRSTQEAEDVQQEVFVTALSALRNGAGPATFRPWLYRVAHNACISHMRAKRPNLVAVDGEIIASATTEPASEEREELRQLLDDLSALPEVQRGALLLREMDGFSYEQVGEVLGLPVTTVRSTIFRARSTLQGLAEARDAKCEEIQAELSELADRRGRRSRRITSHLHVCSDCRDFRADLRSRPAILSGFVPALPVGVLASVKAAVIGAQSVAGGTAAGGAAAGAAAAGASGGFGLLGGTGASKLVAAAASAAALIGGAGTQVGVLGGGGAQGTGGAPATTVVVTDAAAAGGGGRSEAAAGDHAASTTHSGIVPASVQGGTSHLAPGTVAWRPANGDLSAGDTAHADGGRDSTSLGHGTTVGAVGATHHAGTSTNGHWGYASAGAPGHIAGAGSPGSARGRDDDDDDSDAAPARSTGSKQRSERRRDSSSDSRTGSTTTNSVAAPTDGSIGQRGADGGGRDDEPARGQQGSGEAPAATSKPGDGPAPDSARSDSGQPSPSTDAPKSGPAPEPAPADSATSPATDAPATTTAPGDPAPDSSAASPAPDPAADSAAPTDPAPAPNAP
jgi:RNA polymerase sigma factor (sigma-70 family)